MVGSHRSALPAASRKLEFLAPEELRRAILIVVQESYGIVTAEVPNAVCRVFGFSRVTDDMSAAVEPHRDALLREGYLTLQGVNLVLGSPDAHSREHCEQQSEGLGRHGSPGRIRGLDKTEHRGPHSSIWRDIGLQPELESSVS